MGHLHMTRRASLAVLAATLLCAALAACSTGPRRVESTSDYQSFGSAAELIAEAELIIHGVVKATRVEEQPRFAESTDDDPARNPPAGTRAEELNRLPGFVVTIATVSVVETFKGPVEAGSEVEVLQMGGRRDGVLYRGKATTMLSTEEKNGYVLFLNSYGGTAYQLPNPRQAMFIVSDDGSLVAVGGDASVPIASLSELRTLVAE